LIPGKARDNLKNNLYVKNIPLSYTEEDLSKYFSQFGEVKSVFISRDNGGSRGFGFVSFNNPGSANKAKKTLAEKPEYLTSEPLYVSYAMKKDDRLERLGKDKYKLEKLTIFLKPRDALYTVSFSITVLERRWS
jgi:RNA recognition motif-containing protein